MPWDINSCVGGCRCLGWWQVFFAAKTKKENRSSSGHQRSASIIYAHFAQRGRKKMRNDWSFYAVFPRGWKGARRSGSLEATTAASCPPHPLIYPSLLSAGLLRVRQYFHIVSLNTMWPYLLPSPQTATAYLQQHLGLKRPIEAASDEIWSCQRVGPPPLRDTASDSCVF